MQRLADRVAAVFVPAVIVLAVGDVRLLDRQRRGTDVRLLGDGRRPDRRVPVRARAGDADGAARRHRPRRAARDPDQGPGDAGVDAAHRHDRPRQDGHGHRGQAGSRRRRHGRRAPTAPRRYASSAPSSTRPSIRSPRAIASGSRARSAARRGRSSRTATASASRASSTATPSSSAARRSLRSGASSSRRARARRRARAGRRQDRDRGGLGRRGARGLRRRRHGQALERRSDRRAEAPRPAPDATYGRQRVGGAAPSPPRSGSTTSSPMSCLPTRRPS